MVATWIMRSLRFYGARHAVFACTVALASAVLCAALLTGESLQQGLRRGLRERLGPIRSAVYLPEGTFPAALAQRLRAAQAALLLRGELLDAAGAPCAARVQVIGADVPAPLLNARGLEVLGGREGAVRFEKPRAYSVEMPLGEAKDARLVRRAAAFGTARAAADGAGTIPPDFALQAASLPPVNAWMPLAELAEAAGVPGQANLLVSSEEPGAFARALAAALTPEDAGLVLEDEGGLPAGGRPQTVVKSRRVFLPPGIAAALEAKGLKAAPALFHLADAFEAGTNAAPYGFVAALAPGSGAVPADLGDDEVVVNAWLAGRLGVRAGDAVTLRWRRFEAGGRLVADGRAFRVRAVVPTEAAASAKARMPVFPGLAGVDSCAAWDVGLPLDEEKLKDAANEAYWKRWRETPQAFLSYAAGRACFGAAFGESMSVAVASDAVSVREALRALAPAAFGFAVRPVWDEGVAVASGATDFKGLFVGMAFVLMAAALLLAGLSLSLALEMRKGEVALLGAVGWRRGLIARALVAEWSVPAAAGALAGPLAGAGFAQALVWGLARFWRGAFAGAPVAFGFSWAPAAVAAGVSLALALAVLARAAWRTSGCSPAELWRTSGCSRSEVWPGGLSRARLVAANAVGGALALAAASALVLSPPGAAANGVFFGAGILLMASMLALFGTAGAAWASRGGSDGASLVRGAVGAGVCRALLAPRRSAPVVLLLAVGSFLAIGVLSMKHDPAESCDKPWSGSGGFAAIVTSVVPLERERGLELARRASGAKGVVPVRVHEGDEAGCLNMNRPVRPRVLGLEARALARARAFEPQDAGGVWSKIERTLPDGTLPALAADQAMLQYSLKAKAGAADGTVYEYPGMAGRTVRVRVVGALPVRSGILQGALIVDERAFVGAFDDAGYALWLCDGAPHALRKQGVGGEPAGKQPDSRLRHPAPGVTVETAAERLRLLGSVEGAYLDMFLVLGGLGVVLGALGVALVILRGVVERRGELALLSAVGLPRGQVVRLLAVEYGTLVAAGIAVGVCPALAAVQPAARALGGHMPWRAVAAITAGLALCAGASVFLAAAAAARRYGAEALKEEV